MFEIILTKLFGALWQKWKYCFNENIEKNLQLQKIWQKYLETQMFRKPKKCSGPVVVSGGGIVVGGGI